MHHSKPAIILFILMFANAAFADISDFNRAVQGGDYQAAARETIGIWEAYDRSSPQAATVAREFGFVNYLARDYENALTFARFLVEDGEALAVPDAQPATSALLLRLTEYSLQPQERQRNVLAEALTARLQAPDVDSISLRAAETLYRNDWAARRWEMAAISAAQAAELYARAGSGYLKEVREAALYSAQAEFLENADQEDYGRMVALHNRIVADIGSQAAAQPALANLKWQAEAWVRAMEIYFNESGSQFGTLIRTKFRYHDLSPLEVQATDQVCTGNVDTGTLMYPRELAEQRLAGAVVVRIAFDEEGKAVESEILAEAPAALFSSVVNDALPTFTWEPAAGNAIGCTPREVIHTLGFWGNCAASYVRGACPGTALRTNVQLKDAANL